MLCRRVLTYAWPAQELVAIAAVQVPVSLAVEVQEVIFAVLEVGVDLVSVVQVADELVLVDFGVPLVDETVEWVEVGEGVLEGALELMMVLVDFQVLEEVKWVLVDEWELVLEVVGLVVLE